jgi:predicted GIY-YIG superfamily endonuclease
MSGGYIYILVSQTGTLYIGVTSNLYLRVMQHEFKDLAQTCGWKMITAHEKMYP